MIDQAHPSLLVSHAGFALAAEPGALDIEELSGGEAPEVECRASDDALVMYSSGSTGRPKGVVHTHASLEVKTRQIAEIHGLTSDDCVLMPAPLAHVSGLLHGVLVPAALGAKTVLMEQWHPGVALQAIEREQVTWMVGPPTFFIDLMEDPTFDPERVASLRLIIVRRCRRHASVRAAGKPRTRRRGEAHLRFDRSSERHHQPLRRPC